MITKLLLKLYKSSTILIMVIGTLFWGVYEVVKPTKPVYSPRQKATLNELVTHLNQWAVQSKAVRGKAVLLTFDRDPFGKVTDAVRQALWRSDRFDLLDYTISERLCRKIEWTRPMVESREEALKIAGKNESAYAVWGVVNEFSDIQGTSKLDCSVEIISAPSGETVSKKKFSISSGTSPAISLNTKEQVYVEVEDDMPLTTRIFIWALIIIILPIATYPLARHLMTRDSNAIVLLTLTGYALVGVIAAYFIFAVDAKGWIKGGVFLISIGLTMLYNWKALEQIKTMNE